jgi:hypothetical protein
MFSSVLFQVQDSSPDGQKMTANYRITAMPAILVVDPMTGEGAALSDRC